MEQLRPTGIIPSARTRNEPARGLKDVTWQK